MNAPCFQSVPVRTPGVPGGPLGAHARGCRGAFTLVELLVVVSIILVLMSLIGAGVSAARSSQKKQATQALITRIDTIIQKQYSTYASRSVPPYILTGTNKSADRAVFLRRLASAEMPDSWADVKAIASGSAGVPRTGPQNAYAGVYQLLSATNAAYPTSTYADAECLFMIVTQGGVADCLDCGGLRSSLSSLTCDIDLDGALEFRDAWGNPIRYVLWPAALELPPGSGKFFSTTAPFTSGSYAAANSGVMRPLIFSCGPDGKSCIAVNDAGNLGPGVIPGDPTGSTLGGFSPPTDDPTDGRGDNITNFDAEVAK